MTTKSIADIKIDINNLTNDIKDLDYDGKVAAIQHMKETISLLKLGNEFVTQTAAIEDEYLNLSHETLGEKAPYIEDDSKNDLLNDTDASYNSIEFLEAATTKKEDTALHVESIGDQDRVEIMDFTQDDKGETTRNDGIPEIFNLTKDVKQEHLQDDSESILYEFQDDPKGKLDVKEEESLKVERKPNTFLQIYQCNECPAYFYTERPLKTHKNVHTDKYKCDTCQQRLCTGTELRKHQCDKRKGRSQIFYLNVSNVQKSIQTKIL